MSSQNTFDSILISTDDGRPRLIITDRGQIDVGPEFSALITGATDEQQRRIATAVAVLVEIAWLRGEDLQCTP